jgi:N-methylhydantoinase A/oxoprolinase/acetone carboxylase beta subunit
MALLSRAPGRAFGGLGGDARLEEARELRVDLARACADVEQRASRRLGQEAIEARRVEEHEPIRVEPRAGVVVIGDATHRAQRHRLHRREAVGLRGRDERIGPRHRDEGAAQGLGERGPRRDC